MPSLPLPDLDPNPDPNPDVKIKAIATYVSGRKEEILWTNPHSPFSMSTATSRRPAPPQGQPIPYPPAFRRRHVSIRVTPTAFQGHARYYQGIYKPPPH